MTRFPWRHACAGTLAAITLACQAQQALPVVPRPIAPPEPAAPARALDLKAPPRPALPARDGVSVRVERFGVSGNTRIGGNEIAAVLQPFEQRTLGFAELTAAADAVTTLYRQRGWLFALAYLPEQKIEGGTVEIVVLEGRLGSLAIAAAPPGLDRALASSVAQWNIASGDVIGEANLVRNLLVLNEWAGVAVGADVRPGRQVGTADVTVDLRDTGPRYSGSVSLDNLGSKATGRVRAGASFTAREFAGRGDQFDAQALVGTEGGLRSYAASYAFMLHPSGTRLTASLSQLDYTLVDPAFDGLDAKGEATYLQVTIDQPVLRRVGDAVTLRAGVGGKRLRDRVEAFAQHEDRHIETLMLALRGEHGSGNAPITRWSVGVTAGQVGFDDAVALAADQALRRTAGRFGHLKVDVAHQRPLSDTLTLAGRLAWHQALHRNLDAAERSVLGGAGALRPYGDLPVQADEATQVSLELRWRTSIAGLPATASAFYDRGVGHIDHSTDGTTDNGVRARLVGVAVECQLPADTTLRMAATRQNAQPAPAGSPAWLTRGWLEVAKAF